MRTAIILSTALLLAAPSESPLREIQIVANDYAFVMPAELPPGPAAFAFKNEGKVRHELNISLLREGVTVEQFMANLWADKPSGPLIEGPVGVLFAKKESHSSAKLETNLKAGRDYVVICIFRDSAGAKRHHQLGMYSRLHVSGRKNVVNRKAKIDTITGLDYAFRYNAVMKPGLHRFMFVNTGKQRHEVSFELLRSGVSLDSLLKADKAGENVDKLLDESPALLHAPGGKTALGYVTLDLKPGREYMIECAFQDSAKAPMHYELGMYGSIKVTRH